MASQKDGGIPWTDKTWNPLRGCSRVSPGCLNCYAEKIAARFSDGEMIDQETGEITDAQPFHLYAERKPQPHWTGKVGLVEKHLMDPLKWKTPHRIFVNSMSDMFHEELPDEAIDRVFAVMALCHWHCFQVLTKRPHRMLAYMSAPDRHSRIVEAINAVLPPPRRGLQVVAVRWPLPGVWLGVSVENQEWADKRIPLLLRTPAAKRFVSYEPALGPVDFESIPMCMDENEPHIEDLRPDNPLALHYIRHGRPGIDWIIVGGESGPGARPFEVAWAWDTVRQCRVSGVACFVKQLGAKPVIPGHRQAHWDWGPGIGLPESATRFTAVEPVRESNGLWRIHLKDRKGGDMAEWAEHLRVREFPV